MKQPIRYFQTPEDNSQRYAGVPQEQGDVRLPAGVRIGCAECSAISCLCGFYHAQTKVFETQPKELVEAWSNRIRTVPITFSIDLNQLPPGQYDCQITVLNPTKQKGMFWQAPVMLVP